MSFYHHFFNHVLTERLVYILDFGDVSPIGKCFRE